MEINKDALLTALEVVKPGLTNKESIEQGTSFAFVNSNVITFNNEISISHPVDGMSDITGAVEAEKLYQLLGKLKAEKVNITLDEKHNEIVVKSGRIRAGLTIQSEIKFPLTEDISERGEWAALPEDFVKNLQFVIPSCSKNFNQPIITCVHVHRSGFVEASDNYCLARYMLKDKMPVPTFLIPATSAQHLVRFAPKEVAHGTGWVHFRADSGATFSCRIFNDTYPETSHFLKVEGLSIVLPDKMNEAVERAWVFAKRENTLEETLTVTLNKNHIDIRSESDNAWFEERVDNVNYDGDRLHFGITPVLLRDILTKTQQCTLGVRLLKFEGTDWVFVSALKVVKDE